MKYMLAVCFLFPAIIRIIIIHVYNSIEMCKFCFPKQQSWIWRFHFYDRNSNIPCLSFGLSLSLLTYLLTRSSKTNYERTTGELTIFISLTIDDYLTVATDGSKHTNYWLQVFIANNLTDRRPITSWRNWPIRSITRV